MKIKSLLYEKNLIDCDAKSVVFYGDDGQTGILENHAPIILFAKKGYLKITTLLGEKFIYFERGIFSFAGNLGVLLASNGALASNKDEAFEIFRLSQERIKKLSYSDDIDYSKLERELIDNIKKGTPSRL